MQRKGRHIMFYDTLNTEEQVSYLIKPIIEVLQEAGGQLERAEIRDRISEKDEKIAEFEQKLYTSNKTGSKYKKFDFKFNFALKELSYLGFLTYVRYKPLVTLTEKEPLLMFQILMLRRRFEKRQLFIGKKNQLRIKRRIV